MEATARQSRSGALLAIETAGSNCSVAVVRGGAILAAERRPLRHGHAEVLVPMVERVLAAADLVPSRLAAVAAAIGPGGFTGIRVGLAAARGIALAVGAQMVGVSSFAAVAAAVGTGGLPAGGRLLVALDSRRADLYVQLFDPEGAALSEPRALLPERLTDYVAGLASGAPLRVAGDAAGPAAAALGRAVADVALASAPDALGVAASAQRQLGGGAAIAPARPLYLRPPDVTLPSRRETIPAGTP